MGREASISVRVEDYLTDEDIEELLREAIREEAREQLRKRFDRTDGATLVWYMARAAVEDVLGEKCEDMKKQLEDELRRVIGELSRYDVFGFSSRAWLTSKEEPRASACGACRYFYQCKTLREWEDGAEPDSGECRRMPPVLVDDGALGYWPMVDVSDWCGEWRP